MTTPEQTEKPKMDASANGLWWLKSCDEWTIANLEHSFCARAGGSNSIQAKTFSSSGISLVIFTNEGQLSKRTWGGRILNPDQQEAK